MQAEPMHACVQDILHAAAQKPIGMQAMFSVYIYRYTKTTFYIYTRLQKVSVYILLINIRDTNKRTILGSIYLDNRYKTNTITAKANTISLI